MASEFEALVGHLHVVGGRSITAAPPGALVEVAPRKAARGRELDTFFTLVFPSGDEAAPAKFYEQMAALAAERYFNSSGSVTAGLRAVFNSLNDDLVTHNQSQGSKRRYEANMLAAVVRDDELFLARAGCGVALYRSQGDPTPFPAEFHQDDVIFGPPLGVHPVPDVRMSRYTVLSGARLVLATPGLAEMDALKTRQALEAGDIAGVLAGFKALASDHLMLMAVEFVPPDVPSPVPAQEAESTARVPVASAPAPAPAPTAPPQRPGAALERRARAGLRAAALNGAQAADGAAGLLDRLFPTPAEGEPRASGKLAGAAVLIPIAIVLLVLVLWLGGTGESEFELCVKEANRTAEVARSIASSDVAGTQAAWTVVMQVVERCNSLRSGDPGLQALNREAQRVVDILLGVQRRDARPIATFTNAQLKQIVLQGLDLYVLDAQNQWVYRVTLTSDGQSVVANSQQPIPAMRQGATIGQNRVAELVDIFWAQETAQIIALDKGGLIIQCSPRFLQSCDAQRLLAAERWVQPAAITLWQGRLYILDPGANQIWRYEQSGGAYASVPGEYFVGAARPDLRAAVDFGIDDQGNIYILMADGLVTKWRSGSQTPFAFTGFYEGQEITSADAMFLNTDPTAQGLYIVSRATRTIYETSLAGTFSNSYRAFNEPDFALLAGVVPDKSQQTLYAISGNTVFAIRRQG